MRTAAAASHSFGVLMLTTIEIYAPLRKFFFLVLVVVVVVDIGKLFHL
jgi:hypothetical protein